MIDCLTGGLKKIKFKRLFNINRKEYNIQVFLCFTSCVAQTQKWSPALNNRFSLNKSRFTSTWFSANLTTTNCHA